MAVLSFLGHRDPDHNGQAAGAWTISGLEGGPIEGETSYGKGAALTASEAECRAGIDALRDLADAGWTGGVRLRCSNPDIPTRLAGRPSDPASRRENQLLDELRQLAYRFPHRTVRLVPEGELDALRARAREVCVTSAVGIDCKHGLALGTCSICRNVSGPQVFITEGGDAYHRNRDCEWLHRGLAIARSAERQNHAIEAVGLDSERLCARFPCRWCKPRKRR